MAEYRVFCADSLTGNLIEELPFDVSSYSQAINGVGTLTATLALGDIPAGVNWQGATTVKRTLIVVQRNGSYVWAGYLMKRRPTDGGTKAEITCETLEGYLARRRIKTDLTYSSATDVFTIVRGIIDQLQAVGNGNMNLAYDTNLAGQTATVTYLGKDRTKALDAFNRLAEIAPGFEYTITWSRAGSTFTPTLTLAAPGLNVGLDAIVFEYPGNAADYSYDEDGGNAPNALTGVGADSGGVPLMDEETDSLGELAHGYPIYEDEWQAKDETVLAHLQARTQTVLAAQLADYAVPTVDLRGDSIPGFGDFALGAPARLRATSLYHPAGLNGAPGVDVLRRVTGWTVTPGPPEKVSLTLGSTTGKIVAPAKRRTQAAYLRDLDRRLRTLETT